MLTLQEMQARLRLFRSTNIGCVAFRQFLQYYGSAEIAIEALPKLYRGKVIELVPKQQIITEWQNLEKIGGKFLFHDQPDFPPNMLNLPDAPPILSVLGNVELLVRQNIAIVGARNASMNGLKIAAQLANDLTKQDYNVVTGFARGIDSAAHKAAIANAAGIAIFAGGVDYVYPRENQKIYQETLRYGAVISEMKLGYQPAASSFPKRNRIISALAKAVIVVEAAERSGSLITAKFAKKHDRLLCALPGSPLDPRAYGTNRLIKTKQAHLIENAEDLMALLDSPALLQSQENFIVEPELDFESNLLNEALQKLPEALNTTPSGIDDLIRYLDMPAGLANAALLLLEIQGKIERMPGNKFAWLG